MISTFTTLEKDGYLIRPNSPDTINDYKLSTSNYTIASNERNLYFGELNVYNILRVEGELNVLDGSLFSNVLNYDIVNDETIYGTLFINDEIRIGAELTVI